MNCKFWCVTVMIVLLTAFFLVFTGEVQAAEFSADLVQSSGSDSETGKVYIKGKLRRQEFTEGGKVAGVSIVRPDKGVTWNLMPDEKMYMEIPLDPGDSESREDMESLDSVAKMVSLGKETVSGYKCEKRRYEYHDKTQGSFIMWYSPKLNYPVKLQMKGHGKEGDLVMEYKNIKTGKIPDSMFEIPKGYEKFSIPGMPAGMPSIPGMGK